MILTSRLLQVLRAFFRVAEAVRYSIIAVCDKRGWYSLRNRNIALANLVFHWGLVL